MKTTAYYTQQELQHDLPFDSRLRIQNALKEKLRVFAADIANYDVPFDLRIYNGIALYPTALRQLDEYFNGIITEADIFYNPDNILRNVMLLWSIDKKKLK